MGIPWTGDMGITMTVDQIMAQPDSIANLIIPREHETRIKKKKNPDAIDRPAYPYDPTIDYANYGDAERTPTQTIGVNFLAPVLSQSGFIPPDNNGAAGPTQILVVANGRIHVYSKTGVLGALNVTINTFFNSVRNNSTVSDPHIRYDRLTQRWFVVAINVSSTNNRVLIAVSSGPVITGTTSFTFFYFQHDLAPPAGDSGKFLDYPTLGVDANALYIGGVRFIGNAFDGCPAFVVRKSSVTGAGPVVVTAFRTAGGAASGIFVPQGVDNDDPLATEGYFVGTDAGVFSLLNFTRVNNPGTTPSITNLTPLTVLTNNFPLLQVHAGVAANRRLDGLDDRLFAAHVMKNKLTGITTLWIAHNTRVNSAGTASGTMNRNAARWYQIGNMTTTTPTFVQGGTLYDNAATNYRGFWISSIAMSGQGHAVLVNSTASAVNFCDVAVAGRYNTDIAGILQPFVLATSSNSAYLVQGVDGQRWGDYSQVVVDPNDNMTLWAFEEYTNATNSWGVRVVQLIAPAPPPTASLNSLPIVGIVPSVVVNVVAGSTPNNTGFFDPGTDAGGPGFANRISASVTGSITVNSITFIGDTQVDLDLNTSAAISGTYTITITNPDGQFTTLPISVAAFQLPLELISFTAQPYGNDVELNWVTDWEINTDHFKIEKSKDGVIFYEEAIVPAAGFSALPLNYSLIDEDPYEGVSYYRLLQTGLDGGASYSSIVSVQMNQATLQIISTHSEGDQLYIYLESENSGSLQYTLSDMLGRTISNGSFDVVPGENQLLLDGTLMSSGIHLFTISNGADVLSAKFFY